MRPGVAQFQHGLQNPWQSKTRLWVAQRRRFAEYDNANGVRTFGFGKANGFRHSGHGRPEKSPAKLVVLNQNLLSIMLHWKQESCGIAKANEPQNQFNHSEKNERKAGQNRKTEEPQFPPAQAQRNQSRFALV